MCFRYSYVKLCEFEIEDIEGIKILYVMNEFWKSLENSAINFKKRLKIIYENELL